MRSLVPSVAAGAFVAYWTSWTLASERVFGEPAALHGLIYDNAYLVYGIVVGAVAGFCVGRWWVLVLGATPVAVFAGLEAVGHVAPYHEAAPPLTHFWQTGGWWPFFWLCVSPLSVGVVLRRGVAPTPRRNVPFAKS
jgi:hypothetical protein